jgi:hypothetical protein
MLIIILLARLSELMLTKFYSLFLDSNPVVSSDSEMIQKVLSVQILGIVPWMGISLLEGLYKTNTKTEAVYKHSFP